MLEKPDSVQQKLILSAVERVAKELVERYRDKAERVFDDTRRRLESGDRSAILSSMHFCTFYRIPPPDWLATAFCDAFESCERYQTWDDAFGPPMPKGTKNARRKMRRYDLAAKITELREVRGAAGQALYEQAATELKNEQPETELKNWQTVRDIYYRVPNEVRGVLRDIYRFVTHIVLAERRYGIRLPSGELAVSPEEALAWLAAFLEADGNLAQPPPPAS
jgi:hypothetical protein